LALILSAFICVKSSFSLADLLGFYLRIFDLRSSALNLLFFLADLRGFMLRPSAYLQSASICVKSSFSLADLRGFSLLPSAYLQSAFICVKSSLFFSLIYEDFR